jgi:hypothetical protein
VSIARLNPILAVLTTSSNAGTYSDHPAYPGFGRRLSEPSTPNGGDLYIPNGAKSVGSTWYALKNGANSDLTARLGGVGGGNENPSSQGGWHQGAYSPYGWVGKTSNADEQACDFPADTSPIGFDDSATCYPPWGLMCADGNNVDVVKLRFLIMWKFNGKYVYDVEVQGDGRATNQWPEPDLQVEVLQPTNVGTADAPIADVAMKLTFGTGAMLSDTIHNYETIVYHVRGDGSASGAPSAGDFCTGASQGTNSGGWTISVG